MNMRPFSTQQHLRHNHPRPRLQKGTIKKKVLNQQQTAPCRGTTKLPEQICDGEKIKIQDTPKTRQRLPVESERSRCVLRCIFAARHPLVKYFFNAAFREETQRQNTKHVFFFSLSSRDQEARVSQRAKKNKKGRSRKQSQKLFGPAHRTHARRETNRYDI